MGNLNRYAVTFVETKKRYNPARQTVEVLTAGGSGAAQHLVECMFGSFGKDGLPSKKSKILIVETSKMKGESK
jgi:hypothetical protein